MMTEHKHQMYEDLCDISRYMQDISGQRNPNQILYSLAEVMSEDNLHEVIAAICDKIDYDMGYDYWYGDRANYLDTKETFG